ncbi:MAG: TIGR03619 family F420-dependent LLM class oxidoreductase [Deltaproteobacteria bacterium]|nr:TIGR03619 family F420-dependent LLM class oxidoreductase [Deltaproteobacteria bacterium]
MQDSVSVVPPGKLVFGIHLPIAAQSKAFAQGWESGAGTAEIRRIAEVCDRAGYFYLAVSDHVAVPRDLAPAMSTVWYDTVATLGFVAAATARIRLLSYVAVLPYRHPLVTAKSYATVDALSDGRLILGVGAGHVEKEFEALGIDFRRRGKLLDEAIDAVADAFRSEYPSFEGPTWSYRDLGQQPRPVQKPRPPIWVGGSTEAALRRAAERGDGWLPQGPPAMGMAAAIDLVRSHREKKRGGAPIDIGMNAPWMYVGEPSWTVPEGTLTGSAERLLEPIWSARKLGVSHVGVRFRARSCDELCEQLEAFATEVAPHAES